MTDAQILELFEQLRSDFRRLEERLDRRFALIQANFVEQGQRLDAIHAEMIERFESVDRRLAALERRAAHGESRLDALMNEINQLRREMQQLASRVDTLGADMLQRFRVLTERLAAVEKKIAA